MLWAGAPLGNHHACGHWALQSHHLKEAELGAVHGLVLGGPTATRTVSIVLVPSRLLRAPEGLALALAIALAHGEELEEVRFVALRTHFGLIKRHKIKINVSFSTAS